jgi:hypothetical protein
MSLSLPHVHVRFTGETPTVEAAGVPAEVVRELVALDQRAAPSTTPGDRARPVGEGWAVGRGGFGGVVWRIVPGAAREQLAHPAWIWRSSRWFDPTAPPVGALPGPLALRGALDPAARLTGGAERTASLISGIVSRLRRHEGPIAVVVDPAVLPDPAPAGRWFLLALLTVLPPAARARLRVSSFEASPAPGAWDVVVTPSAPAGYRAMLPGEPVDLANDVPARFVLESLLADDPEQVERAALWAEPNDSDPWGAAVHRRWIALIPPAPSPEAPPPTRERPAAAPPRRLHLNTPEAWLSLSDRRDEERAAIVRAWANRPDAPPPAEAILGAVIQIRPRGRDVAVWIEALLRWAETGAARLAAVRELGAVLEAEALPLEPAVRASVWTEYIASLLDLGQFGEALAACDDASARALIQAGAGEVVAEAWTQLPASRRPEGALRALVERLCDSPKGQPGLTHLWQALIVQEHDTRADVLLQVVGDRAARGACCPIHTLLDLLAGSPQAMRWVGHIARKAPPTALATLVAPVTSGPGDPLWEHFLDVRSQHAPAEHRIADLIGLPLELVRRSERDLRDVIASIRVWRFPDRAVAAGAGRLASIDGVPALWSWLQLCASGPDQRPSSGTASLVDALCLRPPTSNDERSAVWMMTEGMGAAEGWTPPQHAELLLRLALTPSSVDPNLPLDLGASLVRGVARRADAAVHLAALTDQVALLPPGHPATQVFLQRLLPVAFSRGVPAAYIRAVRPGSWSAPTRDLWQRIIQSLGRVG